MATPTATQPVRSASLRAVALFVALLGGSTAVAQLSEPPVPIGLREQVIREQCRREAAVWELREYQTVLPKQFKLERPTVLEFEKAVTDHLHDSYPATKAAADQREREQKAVAQQWAAAMTRRATFQERLDASEQENGFDWGSRTVADFRLGDVDFGLLAAGVAATAFGGWRAGRRFRVGIRRARRARAMRSAVAVLAPLGLLTAFAGCTPPSRQQRPWAELQREELSAQFIALKVEADRSAKEADQARQKLLERWGVQEPGDLLGLRDILTSALVAERMNKEAEEERTKLDADEKQLAELSRAARQQGATRTLLRVGGGLFFAVTAVAPYLLARRWERRRRRTEADTCPRCLARGKLKERRTKGDQGAVVIECGGCGYRCPQNTRAMPRLCFPTVGIRSSGKTHLLATAYASVKNRNTRTAAVVQQAPSMGDEQFNTYIELVLKQRATAGATVHDLPAPIVLCVRDADPGGANTVLVNLFDYSGEMMTQAIGVDDLRRRAVRMDGFLMLFDPTQMYGDDADGEDTLALEDQLKALHEFYLDMLDARGLPPGQVVPVPVAVCVSKFDLVSTRSPMGGQAIPFLQTLKTDLDPPDELTLGLLHERSRLVEKMLPFMLPGIDLRKTLREYFGNQFLFFPSSDRGLTAGAKGGAFGVVEPLLWLLHMHGYCVLKGD